MSRLTPPPDVFINIEAARMIDEHTLEVTFTWPRCADAASIRADWMGASPTADGGWDVSFSLQERRAEHGVPACTGPVEQRTLEVDLRAVLREDMTRGVLEINGESLYGYMKTLPTLNVPFDLAPRA